MTKPSTGESPPQPNEQPQPRHRNIYDCDGEYEFPNVQHWTAKSFEQRPRHVRFNSQ